MFYSNQKGKIHTSRRRKKSIIDLRIVVAPFVVACLFISATSLKAQDLSDSLSPVQLSEVGVKWVKPSGEESFSATNINKADIQQNIGNGSINNLLEMVPSMITTSDAGTGIGYTYMRIRGIDQTRINVTINGIALNDAESQGSWFVNVPDLGSKVEALEVQRGVGTSNNGSAAFGATMNFVTIDNSHKRFVELSSSVGSFATFRNAITVGTGLIGDCFAATISYSNLLSDGYIDRASAKLHNLFFSSDFYLKNKKKNENYGRLKLNIMYGNEKTGLAWNGVPSYMLDSNRRYNSCGEYYDVQGHKRYYSNQTDNYQQLHMQLFYDYSKAITKRNRVDVNVGVHCTPGKGYYEEYVESGAYADYGLPDQIIGADTFAIGDFITRKGMKNYFYGLVFSVQETFSHLGADKNENPRKNVLRWSLGGALNNYDGAYPGTLEWAEYGGVGERHLWFNGTGRKTQFNIYGTVDYREKRWCVYLDLQYRLIDYHIGGTNLYMTDISQQHLWHFFNPKFGVSVDLDKDSKHSLYTSFARSNREPTRSDLADSPLDRRPVPETLYDWELGYRMHLKKYAFNANAYFMCYDNQLVLTGQINDVGAAIMTNVKKSYRLGIELISSYQPVKFFRWDIKGTFSINKILDYTQYIDDWDTGGQRVENLGTTDISYSPNIVASNEFAFYPLEDFNISLQTHFVSRQYVDNSSNKNYSIKPYCVSNFSMSYCFHTKPVSDIELFFKINNVFNAKYESNAWVYRYYFNGQEEFTDGFFPQAGINFLGGIRVKM